MCIRDRYQRRVHGDFIYISHNILFKRGLSEVVGMNQRTKEVKLVIVGQSGVGKSSILLRFVTGDFKEDKTETMGASFLAKSFLYNGRFIKYQIWDTAGQEKYKSLVSMYYKDSKVALIVYDITNKDSFDAMKSWVQELKENGPSNLSKSSLMPLQMSSINFQFWLWWGIRQISKTESRSRGKTL
eukprot:TRINITY_DN4507_c0_g1_i3.p1 TRINITY_DN4507_c0_g1~~TRINITY_DN4507_c0_g1_i3.p1  ORF type:complete len:212 (+),score=53.10 TRINITY_DN4507_c0_g1_i3:83-637(+)